MAHTIVSLTIAALLSLAGVSAEAQQTPPYKNPLLSAEVRVDDLLGRMTLDEKTAQIRHLHSWDIFNGGSWTKRDWKKCAPGADMAFPKVSRCLPLTAAGTSVRYKSIRWETHGWAFPLFR